MKSISQGKKLMERHTQSSNRKSAINRKDKIGDKPSKREGAIASKLNAV